MCYSIHANSRLSIHVLVHTLTNNNNFFNLKMHKIEYWNNSGISHLSLVLWSNQEVHVSCAALRKGRKTVLHLQRASRVLCSLLSPCSTSVSPFHGFITSPVPSETASKGEMRLESQETPQCWEHQPLLCTVLAEQSGVKCVKNAHRNNSFCSNFVSQTCEKQHWISPGITV